VPTLLYRKRIRTSQRAVTRLSEIADLLNSASPRDAPYCTGMVIEELTSRYGRLYLRAKLRSVTRHNGLRKVLEARVGHPRVAR
jgi:hypothetical protein